MKKRVLKYFLLVTSILMLVVMIVNLFVVDKKDNCQVNKIKTNEPTVMLTFDDGPGTADNDIVDILNNNSVHATFFETGINLQKFHFTNSDFIKQHSYLNQTMETSDDLEITSVVKKILNSGNTIGNHSFTHSKYNNNLNKFVSEINETNSLIIEIYKEVLSQDISNSDIPVRMPYLQYYPGLTNALKKTGTKFLVRGYLGTDYNEEKTGKEKILSQYKSHWENGIIFCCHTRNYAKTWLEDLIVWLHNKKYVDSDNFATFSTNINEKWSYKEKGDLIW